MSEHIFAAPALIFPSQLTSGNCSHTQSYFNLTNDKLPATQSLLSTGNKLPALDLHSLLAAESSLPVQLSLLLAWSLLWYAALPLLAERLFKPFVRRQPWAAQWRRLTVSTWAALGVRFGSEADAFDFGCDFLAVLAQHALGGALCAPAGVLGVCTPLALALARHGALCEVGWELQDLAVRAGQLVAGGEAGRAKNPPGLLFLLAIHHTMGLGLVVPMNLYYGGNQHYHEFVFLLQFAAFAALFLQNYGYTLDVATPSGLARMRAASATTWLVLVYSRCGRYAVVGYRLLSAVAGDGRWAMFGTGVVALVCMGVLNAIFITDATAKVVKYARKQPAAVSREKSC